MLSRLVVLSGVQTKNLQYCFVTAMDRRGGDGGGGYHGKGRGRGRGYHRHRGGGGGYGGGGGGGYRSGGGRYDDSAREDGRSSYHNDRYSSADGSSRNHGSEFRSGGRGGGGFSRGGGGRGGGSGRERPPPGLKGKEIGLWYARRSKNKTAQEEKDNRSYVQMDESKERNLTGLLASIRNSETVPPQPNRYDTEDWFQYDGDKPATNSTVKKESVDSESASGRYFAMPSTSGDTEYGTSQGVRPKTTPSYSSLAGDGFMKLDTEKALNRDRQEGASNDTWESNDDDETDANLMNMVESMEQSYQDSTSTIGNPDEAEDIEAPKLFDYEQEEEDSPFMYEFKKQKLANRQSYERLNDPNMLNSNGQGMYRDNEFDQQMIRYMEEKRSSSRFQKMLEFRKKLPSYNMQKDLIDTINRSQVSVISGETGCGKTTQVSQFLLDDAIQNGRASLCRIVCTQPRRISAISVAERVADERCEKCGEKSVGYQIRLEKKLPNKRGSILYCTTGIVLQWLADNPLLTGTSHIILDEIHERDLHSDFLMIILRDVLPRRPDLKLILMSATLNAEMFSQYYGGCPMMNIPGYTFPVEDFLLEDVIETLGYMHDEPTKPPRIRYGKDKTHSREEQENYLQWCDELYHKGQYSSGTISVLKGHNKEQIDVDLAVALTEHIVQWKPEGAILVFMPGWEQIKKMNDALSRNRPCSNGRCKIIPLHSLMPTVNQREVFERPPPGVRKIVIATNIAETSITIDDVVYVIDCGKIKLKNFDAENNLTTLKPEFVSKANARQRRGRAGRVQPGECYHLFTRYDLDHFADYQLPEMLRTRLEELCLQIKLLKLGKIEPFVQKAMQPPSLEALHASITMLKDINALDDHEELTPLGYHLAKMPVDPHTGKMLLFGAMFSCLDPILTVAASLSYKDAFYIPMGKEAQADRQRRDISEGSQSDHVMLANAFSGWERSMSRGTQWDYCRRNFLSVNVLRLLQDMRGQFARLLAEMQFTSSPDPKWKQSNLNTDKEAIVKAVICAGLYPNVAKVYKARKREGKAGPTRLTTKSEKVVFHMKSVNEQETAPITQWCAYHLKQKTAKIYLYDSTFVTPLSLLLFGGDINLGQNANGECDVSIDNWIQFRSSHRVANLVKELRLELDRLLEYKITHPGPTNWDASQKEGALLRAIVDLINTEEIRKWGNERW